MPITVLNGPSPMVILVLRTIPAELHGVFRIIPRQKAFELEREALEIDGSWGEGGGQILRTSLTLSCLTGRPFRLSNIRARRKDPGLKPQHLLSVRAAAEITGAGVKGDALGSREIEFSPGPIRPGDYVFDVGKIAPSAGATGLVFQTVLVPLGFAGAPSKVILKGGTHVEWAPPADYLREVYLPTASRMGVRAFLENPVKGYYPTGNGTSIVDVRPFDIPLKPIVMDERGRLLDIRITSFVSNLPVTIAQRQTGAAGRMIEGQGLGFVSEAFEVPSPGTGTFTFVLARFENVSAGFSSLGRRGKRAEAVGEEAAGLFLKYFKRKGAVEPHLSDQLVLLAALAKGRSSFTTTEITNHLVTNIYIIEKFLPVRFMVDGRAGDEGKIKVEGGFGD